MKNLEINSFGPIESAEINFGDLTLFVGPQASGKSIVLQLIKLLVDKKHIRRTLTQYGFIWDRSNVGPILDRYFGEGMSRVWTDTSQVKLDKKSYTPEYLLPRQRENVKGAAETLFYVPAQRVVALQQGWPRFFTEYEDSVPYVLRHFSETLRLFLERDLGSEEVIFPRQNKLKELLRESFRSSIFHQGEVLIDRSGKKRFRLRVGNSNLAFMTWSAGQKEFMPLLLSFYWLCPPSAKSRKESLKYVVIEEPEMGLHPRALTSVLLQVMDLMTRGYKVMISTHSSLILEFAWALRHLQEKRSSVNALADLFHLTNMTPSMRTVLESVLKKKVRTYYFMRTEQKVVVKDISTLDASNEDDDVAEWGGLSSFSAQASAIISREVS